jgi:antitoxin (DNA-binding transcriptional repressor) of toxin-antitoxin stability system
MKRATISELKSRLSEHLRAAEAGETKVMDRARPIARVVPLEHDAALAELIPAERSFASVRRIRLAPLRLSMTSLEALLHERGSR